MNGAVAADQADRQRDVTRDNSLNGSEEGDSGKDLVPGTALLAASQEQKSLLHVSRGGLT